MARKLLALLISILILVPLTSCKEVENEEPETVSNNHLLAYVPGYENELVFDKKTGIIYWFHQNTGKNGTAYMAVYLGPNGHPCTYDSKDKKIIELG